MGTHNILAMHNIEFLERMKYTALKLIKNPPETVFMDTQLEGVWRFVRLVDRIIERKILMEMNT